MSHRDAKLRLLWNLLAFVTIAGILMILWTLNRSRGGSTAGARARVRLAERELMISENIVQRFDRTNSPTFHAFGDKLVAVATKQNLRAQIGLAVAERGEYLNAVATNFVQRFQDFNAAQEAMAKIELADIADVIVKPNRSLGGPYEYYEIYAGTNSPAAVSALEFTQISTVITLNDPFAVADAWKTLQTNGIRSSLHPMKRPGRTDTSDRYYVIFVEFADESIAKSLLHR